MCFSTFLTVKLYFILGTAIRGPANPVVTIEMDPTFYHLESGGVSGMRGPPVPATTPSGSALPPALRVRLYELFVQIEREFEVLYAENLGLQERIDWLSSEQQQQQHHQLTQQHHHNNSLRNTNDHLDTPTSSSAAMTSIMNTMTASLPKGMSRGIYAHKIRY